MAKKQKPPDAGPSKAYLVSFGDTMTALLAFFIVMNSLAKEQTGANMYAGTGSFVNSFSGSGSPGNYPGNRSMDMVQKKAQAPIYALSENLKKNQSDGSVGPDATNLKERVMNRDKEQFQKFLQEMQSKIGLQKEEAVVKQVVFDTFTPFDREDGSLSHHAIQLATELFPKLRKPNCRLEIILWPRMPGPAVLAKTLDKSIEVRKEFESKFWLNPAQKKKISYRVKPWLFADAKRPVLSFVVVTTGEPGSTN